MQEVRKASPNKLSLLTIKEPTKNDLNIALEEEEKVAEMKLRMDKISVLDKIHFRMQTIEVLYHDLLQLILSNKKIDAKVTKLEEQLKKEKAMGKAWKTKIKKLEADLMETGVNSDSQKSVKKLLEEKDKMMTSLKKQLKIPATDHPQIEELISFQEEVSSLKQSTLDLKEKGLQLENLKESLQKEKQELVLKATTTE